jgi:hypothetical protein
LLDCRVGSVESPLRSWGLPLTSLTGTAIVAWFVPTALGAGTPDQLSVLVQNRGIEYLTSSGSSQPFPGTLLAGDRIPSRDALLQGTRQVGYDNEPCTVTFDNNDLCQTIVVLAGKGQLEATWLWIGRNTSQYGPRRFTGVIDGGTGAYGHAKGQFTATTLPNGELRLTATLK